MKTLISFLISFVLISPFLTLDAQKTYKAVCDKSDGKVKVVESEDRSPDMVPLKGGFPFFQVAQSWVKENYPDGKCDPAAAVKQNKASADAVSQAATAQQQTSPNQTKPATDPNAFLGVTPGQPPVKNPAFRYRNTSMFLSLLISDLGRVYNLDPPVVPGVNFGIEQLFGTKFYGGTGIHFNTLLGLTDEDDNASSFYSFRIPLFAGFRQIVGRRYWSVDLGLAANTMLKPLTNGSHLSGEVASDFSLNTHTRVRFGNERSAFEFGFDFWLSDILVSEEGFRMKVYSIGYRYSF
jgi:hypothetical protein